MKEWDYKSCDSLWFPIDVEVKWAHTAISRWTGLTLQAWHSGLTYGLLWRDVFRIEKNALQLEIRIKLWDP